MTAGKRTSHDFVSRSAGLGIAISRLRQPVGLTVDGLARLQTKYAGMDIRA